MNAAADVLYTLGKFGNFTQLVLYETCQLNFVLLRDSLIWNLCNTLQNPMESQVLFENCSYYMLITNSLFKHGVRTVICCEKRLTLIFMQQLVYIDARLSVTDCELSAVCCKYSIFCATGSTTKYCSGVFLRGEFSIWLYFLYVRITWYRAGVSKCGVRLQTLLRGPT